MRTQAAKRVVGWGANTRRSNYHAPPPLSLRFCAGSAQVVKERRIFAGIWSVCGKKLFNRGAGVTKSGRIRRLLRTRRRGARPESLGVFAPIGPAQKRRARGLRQKPLPIGGICRAPSDEGGGPRTARRQSVVVSDRLEESESPSGRCVSSTRGISRGAESRAFAAIYNGCPCRNDC